MIALTAPVWQFSKVFSTYQGPVEGRVVHCYRRVGVLVRCGVGARVHGGAQTAHTAAQSGVTCNKGNIRIFGGKLRGF